MLLRFCRKDRGEGLHTEKLMSCIFSKRQRGRDRTMAAEKRHLRKEDCDKTISSFLTSPNVASVSGVLNGKEFACNMGDPSSVPGLRRSPGEGIGNPLQYSCPENSMDRGAWWATGSPRCCKELDTTERLHFHFQSRNRPGFLFMADKWPEFLDKGLSFIVP